MKNKAEKERRKELRRQYDNRPSPLSQEEWEEAMLENHSYYDIDLMIEYEEKRKNKDKKMKQLLYFSAPWCGPCNQLAPLMEEVALQ